MSDFQRKALQVQYGVKTGNPVIDISVVLNGCGLGKYLGYFKRAGFEVIENYKRKSDEEVDAILDNVEKENKVKFPPRHRVSLWKAVRYRWFINPGSVRDFFTRQQIPRLILPKKDFKFRDAETEFKSLDPQRQKMIRRMREDDTEAGGTRSVQFEVFYREPDLFYELIGLQRTLNEWRNTDTRKMILEDPREEVFFAQLQSLEIRLVSRIDVLTNAIATRLIYFLIVCFLGFFNFVLLVLCLYISTSRAYQLDPGLLVRHCFSSKQFWAAIGPLLATLFAFEVARRDVNMVVWLDRFTKMHDALKILRGDLILFRLDSAPRRSLELADMADSVSEKKLRKINIEPVEDLKPFDSWMSRKMSQGVITDDIRNSLEDSKRAVPDSVIPRQLGRSRLIDRVEITSSEELESSDA